jgi:hypothetical protein
MDLEWVIMAILVVLSEALGWTKFFVSSPWSSSPPSDNCSLSFHGQWFLCHDFGLFIAGASHDKSYQVYSILIFVSSF